ncbi:hypothetical protein DFS34DRAFT_597185 [Phlyctochytrium arcticum]|nr:hypothetical protein DFS34DRAFT_597185 [Phlyctochytrium arcticum]
MIRAGFFRAARAGKSRTLIEHRRAGTSAVGQVDWRSYSQQAAMKDSMSSLDLGAMREAETHVPDASLKKSARPSVESSLQKFAKFISSKRKNLIRPLPIQASNTTNVLSRRNDKIEALFHQSDNAARDAFFQGEAAGDHADWTIDDYTYPASCFNQIPADVSHGAVISRDLEMNDQLLEVIVNAHVVREWKQRISYFRLKWWVDEERARSGNQKAVDRDVERTLESMEAQLTKLEDKTILQGLESVIADATKKNWTLTPPVLHIQAYIVNHIPQKVEEWVTLMAQQSVKPSVGEYCGIIRMYGRTGDVRNAQRYLETYLQAITRVMRLLRQFGKKESAVREEEHVFAAFFLAMGDSKKAAIASDALERLMPQSYNALVRAFFAEGDVEAAKALFQRMTDEKALPTPNGFTFNAAFAGAIQAKDLEVASQMLTRLVNEPYARPPSSSTVCSYGRSCLEAGKLAEALAAYQMLIAHGAVPNTLLTIFLLKALFKTQPDEAFNILENRIANPADRAASSLIKAMVEIVDDNVPALLRLQKLAIISGHDRPWLPRIKLLQSYEQ